MKVILPVIDDQGARNMLANSFHNARFVCIYDSQTHDSEWCSINDISEKPGNLTLGLKKRGIYTVISPQMPLMALGLFIESGLKVFRSESKNVEENIRLLNNNQLRSYEVFDAMGMSSCSSGSCNSCSSCN
jgi:predicted Fe-Mo cluster-binding NifX family protein